eukprot:IDg16564t1
MILLSCRERVVLPRVCSQLPQVLVPRSSALQYLSLLSRSSSLASPRYRPRLRYCPIMPAYTPLCQCLSLKLSSPSNTIPTPTLPVRCSKADRRPGSGHYLRLLTKTVHSLGSLQVQAPQERSLSSLLPLCFSPFITFSDLHP